MEPFIEVKLKISIKVKNSCCVQGEKKTVIFINFIFGTEKETPKRPDPDAILNDPRRVKKVGTSSYIPLEEELTKENNLPPPTTTTTKKTSFNLTTSTKKKPNRAKDDNDVTAVKKLSKFFGENNETVSDAVRDPNTIFDNSKAPNQTAFSSSSTASSQHSNLQVSKSKSTTSITTKKKLNSSDDEKQNSNSTQQSNNPNESDGNPRKWFVEYQRLKERKLSFKNPNQDSAAQKFARRQSLSSSLFSSSTLS